jgi:hypothetical protein
MTLLCLTWMFSRCLVLHTHMETLWLSKDLQSQVQLRAACSKGAAELPTYGFGNRTVLGRCMVCMILAKSYSMNRMNRIIR